MTEADWKNVVDTIRPYVVGISTPQGSGTGFLLYGGPSICAVATAAHVVDYAWWWELPIRVEHYASGKSVVLRRSEQVAVVRDTAHDSAAIIFGSNRLPLPRENLSLVPQGKSLRVGLPVAWLGFPAVAPGHLCFFLGTASCWIEDQHQYLVDGVAINGVSGGPAFAVVGEEPMKPTVIGLVSAYIPNRQAGQSLPGLCVVKDLTHLHNVVKDVQSVEQAQDEEAKTAEREPPQPPPSADNQEPPERPQDPD